MSSAQGRAKDRGKSFERTLTTELNLQGLPARRVGQFGGKTDVLVDDLSAIQAKKFAESRFPGWMHDELLGLIDEKPDLVPALVIESAPGRGRRTRRIVAITWEDYLGLLFSLTSQPGGTSG